MSLLIPPSILLCLLFEFAFSRYASVIGDFYPCISLSCPFDLYFCLALLLILVCSSTLVGLHYCLGAITSLCIVIATQGKVIESYVQIAQRLDEVGCYSICRVS
ncbi:membrane protein [gut metagenome]|uniref:Membrane protein n=1 Tax=gut metagenome TaxID=749906 RepID=J9G0Y7_9ZZZZ